MSPSFLQKSESLSRKCAPAALTVFLVLLSAMEWHMAGVSRLMPLFALISIYYWGLFQPEALPYWFLFLLGLLQDTLTTMPLGVSSFINMGLAFVVAKERHLFGKMMFGSIWIGFVSLTFMVIVVQWVIMSIFMAKLLPFYVLQWEMTCFAYPLMHLFLTRIYHNVYDNDF